ncbi:hypothetical protein SEA_GODONK_52 [Gordonia phage GodonK]|uniref:Uncharacterized protein n=1 Tax=Gordonia phage GodonK TaxID=2562192 RepID=A0A4D6E2D0_9CAUD|nr:hypothetical protein HOV33_gp052 [Gordonia phage GodonK]QBZ72671.1 hypothetical protein SEA_GODONK_52 [Gordonia phage GodonK]
MDTQIVYGIGLGFSVGWNIIQFCRIRGFKKRVEPEKKTSDPVKTYGHPRDPVADLRKRLPDLEWPCVWETWVEEDEQCRFIFQVVDVTDDSDEHDALAHGSIGLTHTKEGKSWTSIYRVRSAWPYEDEMQYYTSYLIGCEATMRKVATLAAKKIDKEVKVNYKMGK